MDTIYFRFVRADKNRALEVLLTGRYPSHLIPRIGDGIDFTVGANPVRTVQKVSWHYNDGEITDITVEVT